MVFFVTIGVFKHLLDVGRDEGWIRAGEDCSQQSSNGVDTHSLDREEMAFLGVL